MTRIRYSVAHEIFIMGTGPIFAADGAVYRATVNIFTKGYSIIQYDGSMRGTNEIDGIGKSVLDAKKSVRQHLINLGVKFNKEKRIRKNQ